MKIFAILLALTLTCWAQPKAEDFDLAYTSEDKFLEIYTDHPVDPARCKAISERVLKAYDFVASQEGWHDNKILRAKPLQFRLLGGNLKVLGYAQGPNLMVMRDTYLDDPLSEGTLAHELTHIQDARQLKGAKMPSYLSEGRALTIGHAYRMALGQEHNGYDNQMAGSALHYTAPQAEELLSEYRGRGWDNQAVGTVLVEYMRTRWNGGVPNINPKLSEMIEKMAGGLEFEAAFQKEFGSTYLSMGESFLKFLTDTQSNPQVRLENTIWQGLSPSAHGGDSEDD